MVTRSKRLIAQDSQRFLTLSLQQRGTAIKEQDGRESLIKPGEFSISDSSRLFRKKLQDEFCFTSFHFPREELHVRDEDLRALTATAFTSDTGSAALVATYFARMAREAAGFDAVVGRRFAATAFDLLALLIDERRGRFTSQAPETAAATLVRVKDHIMRNLSDPDLSPSTIAAAHFMSVRYLHKLFELEGATVSGLDPDAAPGAMPQGSSAAPGPRDRGGGRRPALGFRESQPLQSCLPRGLRYDASRMAGSRPAR